MEALLPPVDLPVFGWLAFGTAAAAYGLTDRGRSWLTRVFFLPLYVKLKGDKVLDHETRGMIRGYVRVHPGDCYTEIGRNLGLTNGTLAYHLGVLEREGIIQSAAKGTRRCYYPAGMAVPEDGGGMHAIQKRILTSVEEVPGVSVGDLAAVLGVSSQLAIYHVRKLAEEGRVAFGRRGIKLRVYPAGYEEKEEDA